MITETTTDDSNPPITINDEEREVDDAMGKKFRDK